MHSSFWKHFSTIAKVLILLYIFITSYWMLSESKFSTPFAAIKFSSSDTCIDVVSLASSIPSEELLVRFPYTTYVGGLNTGNSDCVLTQYRALDSSRPGANDIVMQVFINVVTDSLMSARNLYLNSYSPDTALAILGWAERCSEIARIDSRAEVLWNAAADYWFNHLARTMTKQQAVEKDLKFDFRFRYLSQRLAERGYNVNMGDSKVEKFKENLVAGNWAHLISATWNDSGLPLRTAYIFIGLLLIAGVSAVISLIFNLLKKIN